MPCTSNSVVLSWLHSVGQAIGSSTKFRQVAAEPSDGDDDESSHAADEFVTEVKALLHIAIPTLVIQLGFVVPPFLTASYVGRFFGPIYLDGFQLAYLTINLFTLSLLAGLFSASDTLSPQAFGAGNYREVGVIALRGFVGSMSLILPVCMALAFCMADVLVALGEDTEASQHAADWYRIFLVALPFYGLYMATWKFLSAQNVMMPLVIASVLCIGVILPVSMEVLVKLYGFRGSAMAYAVYQISQAVSLLLILWLYRPYHDACWPGLVEAWRDVFHWKPFAQFFYLGLGGIVASSECKPACCACVLLGSRGQRLTTC